MSGEAVLPNLKGWNRWENIRTIRGGRAVPSAVLPRSLYPASEFRSQCNSLHKVWYYPWRMFGLKPFNEFLEKWHGKLSPAIDILISMLVNNTGNQSIAYRIGMIPPPPVCGFCLGDLYKEYQYFTVILQRSENYDEMGLTMTSSIFQRSRLGRIYLHHGTVSTYGKQMIADTEENVLGLDISDRWSGGSFPSSVNITNFNEVDGTSSTFSVSITSVTDDFKFIVSEPSENIAPGDFYEFDTILCLKDPNLLTGFYFGTEDNTGSINIMKRHLSTEKLSQIVFQGVYNEFNESSDIEEEEDFDEWDEPWGYLVSHADIANQYWYHWNNGYVRFPRDDELNEVIFRNEGGIAAAFDQEFNNSSKNLHITTDNRFYEKLFFTGFYVLKGDEGISQVDAGSSFYDSTDGSKWLWVKSTNYEKSEIYQKVEDRYWNTPDFYTVDLERYRDLVKRETGTTADVSSWIEVNNFLRIEISRGGDSKRNNWHSPILAREWLIQDGKYFKILAQPDGNVIDVSLRDITNTHRLDTSESATASILNQYGWFISEHYWGDSLNPLFRVDELISASGLQIKYKYRHPWGDTVEGTFVEYGPETSFYNRFRDDTADAGGTTKLWKKFDGWKFTGDSGNVLPIDSVSFTEGAELTVTLNASVVEINADKLSSLFDNGAMWITFDEPYARTNPTTHGPFFTAETNVLMPPLVPQEPTERGKYFDDGIKMVEYAGRVLRELAIYFYQTCYTGIKMNINKELIVGICGGRWFGVEPPEYKESSSENCIQIDGAIAMPYNDNSYPLQLTTRYGSQGSCCIYDSLSQTDWVAYNDIYTGRLTIRKGQLSFKDNPCKIEVACGKSPFIETASSFPITLNKNYDRVKLIDMKVDSSETGYHLFTIGGDSFYHGFLINADGDIKLRGLSLSGSSTAPLVTDYKYKSFFCSPVYLYHVGKNNLKKSQTLYIGMNTEDGDIGVKNGTPSDIAIEYVHNAQTIDGDSYIDLHQISSGEMMLIYSRPVFEFKMNETINNSKDEENLWRNNNCVHILSTLDNGRTWGCPINNKTSIDFEKYQWPLMVINGVNYKFSLYDQVSQVLTVFCECNKLVNKGDIDEIVRPFLSAFKIPIYSLAYESQVCIPEPDSGSYKFLFRYPRLTEASSVWTDDDFKPVGVAAPSTDLIDKFIKIIGHPDTESQIEDDNVNYGNINGFISKNGYTNLLFDEEGAISLIFSYDSGNTWQKSQIKLSRESSSGLIIGRYLFYITVKGIESKLMDSVLFEHAYKNIAGVSETFIEETQSKFDEIPSYLVVGGNISPQRLTGYEDSQGIGHLFYYNSTGILSCMKSDNFKVWAFEDNF